MNQLRGIFVSLFVVNLFSLGFSLECPTCLNDECSQENIPIVECRLDTIKDLPDGLQIPYSGNDITTFDCVSLKYTIGSTERQVSQCVIVPIESVGVCSDLLEDHPEDIIIDDCTVHQIEVPVVITEEPTTTTEEPSSTTDDTSSTTDDTSSTTDDTSSTTDDTSSTTDDTSSTTDDTSSTTDDTSSTTDDTSSTTDDTSSTTDDTSSTTDDTSSTTDDTSSTTDDTSSTTDDTSSTTDDTSSTTDDTSESTPGSTTTDCPECGAAFISLSILCSFVVLLRFTL